MPQMAPLLWLYLFIFFSLSLVLFFIMTYFLAPSSKAKLASPSAKAEQLNWKW
uniref:ATP synthase complex subunit 8 n=1 Tax=Typhlatya sp. JR2016 TaxID=2010951 RepID=A0A1Z2R706_9EUCA|nr:ATP synthase F0 subunit 8 [Typhlatya sp. JR2016]